MYNAKNKSNSNLGNYYNRKVVQPFDHQKQKSTNQQPVNKGPITRSKSQQEIQTLAPNNLNQFPEVQSPSMQDNQTIMINLDTNQSVEGSNEEKQDVKRPPKRKLTKKEQRKRLNARVRRLVCPKSPLMVFSELYKDVPIKLDEQILADNGNSVVFTASIEIDGQVYTGNHVTKTQAKQKACENFLRSMLSKKISDQTSSYDKKEKVASSAEDNMEVDGAANSNSVKSKGPPQEDFPWPHFASLAMHNLISHWDLQSARKTTHDVKTVKAVGMKKFPSNPENYNPVQLLHQMSPGIKFNETIISTTIQSRFEASCEMNGVKFMGEGSSKKAAKRESAIAAIKYVWGFDYYSVEKK